MFIVLAEKKIYIPGDERSKNNPGHGYPAEWRTFTEGFHFIDEEDLKRWIAQQPEGANYEVFKGDRVSINRKVQIEIEIE